jgi:hypothetical protein
MGQRLCETKQRVELLCVLVLDRPYASYERFTDARRVQHRNG